MTDSTWHHRYLQLAKNIASWSKDPSRKIGAVAIGSNGQVLSQGYNGFARGVLDLTSRYDDKPTKYKFVVHAEMNCVYNATLNGVSLNQSTMYVWGLPVCSECAKGVIQVGVKKIYWDTDQEVPEKWRESMEFTQIMFNEAGLEMIRL